MNSSSVFDDPGVRRIDPNNGPFEITIVEHKPADGSDPKTVRVINWKKTSVSGKMESGRTFSSKYKDLYFSLFSHPAIEVEMPGGYTNTALLDTGYSGVVYVNDLLVRQSDLAVFPLGVHSGTNCAQGFCEIPSMKIGPIRIENPRCWYEQRHWQLRILGVPLYRHKVMLLGLGMMKQFPYIMFDNEQRCATFSPYDAFEPNDVSQWISHSFKLEKVKGELRIMTDISLGPNTVHVEFDTGGSKPDLILRDDVWREVAADVKAGGGGKVLHPSFQFGWHWCRRYVLPEVQIGQMTLRDAKVDVLPDGSEFGKDFAGIVSLHAFRKTTVVLDFKRKLIWMKKF